MKPSAKDDEQLLMNRSSPGGLLDFLIILIL